MNIRNQKKLLEKYSQRLESLDGNITVVENRIKSINESIETIETNIINYDETQKLLKDNMDKLSDIDTLIDDINIYRDKLLNGIDDLYNTVSDTKRKILTEEADELEKMLSGVPKILRERFDTTITEIKKMHDDLEELKPKEQKDAVECEPCDEFGNNSFMQLRVVGCSDDDIELWNNNEISTSRMIENCVAEPYLYIDNEKQDIRFNLLEDDGMISDNNSAMIASYDIRDKSFFDKNEYMMTLWIGKVENNGLNEFIMETCEHIPKHNEKILDDIVLMSHVKNEIEK